MFLDLVGFLTLTAFVSKHFDCIIAIHKQPFNENIGPVTVSMLVVLFFDSKKKKIHLLLKYNKYIVKVQSILMKDKIVHL